MTTAEHPKKAIKFSLFHSMILGKSNSRQYHKNNVKTKNSGNPKESILKLFSLLSLEERN